MNERQTPSEYRGEVSTHSLPLGLLGIALTFAESVDTVIMLLQKVDELGWVATVGVCIRSVLDLSARKYL